jgi:hypothetical protein
MNATFRPMPVWPHPVTKNRRGRYTFSAPWSDTLDKIDYEVDRLRGSNVIIGAGFEERDIRQDGMPRANANVPRHPGIEISFDTKHGRLVYATDVCEFWQHNVRSIALGLEALRAVDRYGITRKGEQYAGWRELPSGIAMGPAPMTRDEAAGLLAFYAGYDDESFIQRIVEDSDYREHTYRLAAKNTHPDTPGPLASDETFKKIHQAREALRGSS